MLDMGIQAINNVAQIVAFLKIDEVRNMIAVQDITITPNSEKK